MRVVYRMNPGLSLSGRYTRNVLQREIRLIRKYAAALNGFDLTDAAVGDVLIVPDEVAAMLIREGWAESTVIDRHNPPDSSSPKAKR
jgi:hypothetical protein